MAVVEQVEMEYRFYLQAGRAGSNYKSMAEKAHEIAGQFFTGGQEFEVVCAVQGKQDNFTVECLARAKVKVNDGRIT